MSKLGEKIIAALQEHTSVPFPKQGIIAGQAVAEAYFRIKNIPIYTRIKDIDLFFSNKTNENNIYKNITDVEFLKNNISMNINTDKLNYSKDSSGNEMVNLNINSIKILSSFEYDKINFVKVCYYRNNFLEDIVNNFDINLIQIGVCLKTKKVYKTKYFEDFLKTKQMEIINFSRPISTLIRFINKLNNFNGLYGNIDISIKQTVLALKLLEMHKKEKIRKIKLKIKFYEKLSIDKHNTEKNINNNIKNLNKELYKNKNYGNNILAEKINLLNETDKKLLSKYFKFEEIPFKIKKYFNFDSVINPNLTINEFIEKNQIKPTKENFKIIYYSHKDIYKFLMDNKLYSIHSHGINHKILHGAPAEAFREYLNNNKDDRFHIINKNKTDNIDMDKYYVIDNEFKYNDYLTNINKCNDRMEYDTSIIPKNQFDILYLEDNKLLKFTVKNNKNNESIKDNFKIFKQTFYNNKINKYNLDNILSPNIINNNLINFILKNDLSSFINFKISKNNEFNSVLLRYFIKQDLSLYQNIKKLSNNDLLTCLRHHYLTFIIINSKIKEINSKSIKEIAEKIRFLEKNCIMAIGLFETGKLRLPSFFEDNDSIKTKIDEYIKIKDKYSKALIFNDNLFNIEPFTSTKGYRFEQIKTKNHLLMVGNTMKHCVGGRYDYLLNGKSAFFNVYDKERNIYTLEININLNIDKIRFNFVELKGKRNQNPPLKVIKDINIWIKLLEKEYNNNLPLFKSIEWHKENAKKSEEFSIKMCKKLGIEPKDLKNIKEDKNKLN